MKNATEIRETIKNAKMAYDTRQKAFAISWMERDVAEAIEKAALNCKDFVYIPIPVEFRDYFDFIAQYLKSYEYRVQRNKSDLVVFWTI